MAFRRQTFVLLAVLAGVVAVAVLHRPGRAPAELVEALPYRPPTPSEAAAALASLRAPRGFAEDPSCRASVMDPGPQRCFVRIPSLVLGSAPYRKLIAETGLKPEVGLLQCLGFPPWRLPSRQRLRGGGCADVATRDGSSFVVEAQSVVLAGPHGLRATSRSFGHGATRSQGTTIEIEDEGRPR